MPNTKNGPIRILHVLGGMTLGGVESWLVDVLRHTDRDRFRMDFLVHTAEPCVYDDDVRALGGTIIPCLEPTRPLRYARNFKRVMREHGPYDVIHSHVHHYSGYVLRLAQQAGIPIRIAHGHSNRSQREAQVGWRRRGYLRLMEHWIAQHATVGLAVSQAVAADLFGPRWQDDPRWRVQHIGIDFAPFHAAVDADALRAELGIAPGDFVIGHVGRFVEAKNHAFLVEIAAAVAARDPCARLLLVGDGPLRAAVEQQISRMGLDTRVIFAGVRSDVPQLLRRAMDVLVFPSVYEGLPVAIVEAQAAGLPCVMSDIVTEESDVIEPLLRRISLRRSAVEWADAILATRAAASIPTQSEALALVEKTSFNIHRNLKQLEHIYTARQPQECTP